MEKRSIGLRLTCSLVGLLFGLLLMTTLAHAESPQGEFEFMIHGDWAADGLTGNSAWVYDMAGFFHIGLDGKINDQWIILDINQKGTERPGVGTHRIGMSNLSTYSASLEIYNDDDSTVRSDSGELEITQASADGLEGRFEFVTGGITGGPKLTVKGTFKALERE